MLASYDRIRSVFLEAVRNVPRDRWNSFLDEACLGENEMRQQVQRLLDAHVAEGTFPFGHHQIATESFAADIRESVGTFIGPYKLLEQIGEGGMGLVYMAEQQQPVRRLVALKLVKPGMDTKQVLARFEAERQALAMMNHPNIAKVLDAGATEAGRPYFAMELVKGAPITEFCDNHKLDNRHRLQLFITVCQAIQHAHQKGLIHRDIKPSNVIVEMHDVTPVPKVIDFGIAKAIGQQLTDKSLHSGFHQMVGTPLYMSPEQAGQSSIDADTRSDIYSLGVLLYEILTGQPPFEKESLKSAGFDELRRMIREVDPPRPSVRVSTLVAQELSTISDCRNIEARKLSDRLRGELDWIVMKALEKDRNRRYESAIAFAEDLQRYLNDETVLACPPSVGYRFSKFARKNRVPLTTGGLVAAAMVVGTGVAIWQARQAREALHQAELAKRETEIANNQIDARYRIAKEAVDTYLLRVTQDERLNHPSFRQLRQSLLEAALPYYDELLRLAPTDLPSQLARAESLSQLGSVQHEIGNFEQSRHALEESASFWSRLAAADPRRTAYRQNLATVLVHLAEHYRARGALEDMLAYEQRALELREELVTEQPENETYLLELATSYTNVGVAAHNGEARELLERAIQIWQTLSDRTPQNSDYRELLSLGYHNMGHHFAWGRVDEAVPFHERGLELRSKIAIEQPESQKSQVNLAQSHQYLADCLSIRKNQLEKAREHRHEAIRILSRYLENHPHAPAVKAQFAAAKNRLGQTLQQLGKLEQGLENCQSAHAMWRELLAEYPEDFEYEVGLASSQYSLGVLLAALKKSDESLESLQLARERVVATLERIGPYERGSELLRNIYQSLSDTRRALGMTPDPNSDEEYTLSRNQVAGEALRPSKFLTGLSYPLAHGLRAGRQAPILPQTSEHEQIMKHFQKRHRQLVVEKLEDRSLMAVDISISDASAVEGDNKLRYIDDFVSANSGGLRTPRGVVFGPADGMLYVATGLAGQSDGDSSNQILRFDPLTGAFVDVAFTSGDNGVFFDLPWDMTFGPDNKLYVSARRSYNILRYDPSTDTLEEFVPATSGVYRPCGVAFGPDGNLYVSNADNGTTSDSSSLQDQIVRFEGPFSAQPGAFIDVFIHSNGLLDNNQPIVFNGDYLYIGNFRHFQQGNVLRYKLNGDFDSEFIANGSGGLTEPSYLSFHASNLFVNNQSSGQILKYDASGTFVSKVVEVTMEGAAGFTFDDEGKLYVGFLDGRQTSSNADDMARVRRYGPSSLAAFTVSLNTPSATLVTVDYAITDGVGTNGAHAGTDYEATSGTLTLTFAAGQTTRTVLVPTINYGDFEATETFTVNLSNPVGATLARPQGIGTILDDDPFTKFYVVNDGTTAATDQTYRYQAIGQAIGSATGLGSSGNTTPRGAASNAAGDKVWVVDANTKKVYVYDANGSSLGSWTAGGLPSNAKLEGIATNGTDVWLVDAQTDKVYRYDSAAGTTGGTINASGPPINLNSSNLNPKDIVTDGNYLWVVDDSSTDYVFKYTVAGTYVGKWKITTSGVKNPTGITLDPTDVSHLWIVDSGTDRVYQYDVAAGRASGNQAANSSFALAPGNTNPQGIADPPPPGSGLTAAATSVDVENVFEQALVHTPIVMMVDRSMVACTWMQRYSSEDKDVDKYMRQLDVTFPAAPILVSKPVSIPLQSRTRTAENQNIDRAFADIELAELFRETSDDFFKSAIR